MYKYLTKWMIEGKPIEIIYESQNNQYTQRRIKILNMDGSKVMAYCYLRDQIRTFDSDRILSAFPLHLKQKSKKQSINKKHFKSS